MLIDGFLILPGIDQKHRLRVIHRYIIFVPQIPLFRPDGVSRTGSSHLLSKFLSVSVYSCISQINNDAHYSTSPLLSMTFLYQPKDSFFSLLRSPLPSSNLLT